MDGGEGMRRRRFATAAFRAVAQRSTLALLESARVGGNLEQPAPRSFARVPCSGRLLFLTIPVVSTSDVRVRRQVTVRIAAGENRSMRIVDRSTDFGFTISDVRRQIFMRWTSFPGQYSVILSSAKDLAFPATRAVQIAEPGPAGVSPRVAMMSMIV